MPHPLNEQIDRLTARLRRHGWLTGWLLSVSAALGAAGLLIGFDYATRWSDAGARWMATSGWIVAVGWAGYRLLVRPRGGARRPNRDDAAHRVEARYPSLGSRLTSSLEFLAQEQDDPAAGSAELRRAVINQTQTEAEQIDFGAVVDPRPFRRAALVLGGLAAVAALAVMIDAPAVATGLARLAAPWSATDWPRRHQLVFNDAPTRIARGQDFEAVLVDERGAPPADAQIHYRFESPEGRRTERRAPRASGDKLLAILENVQQPFSFRATGGDDHAMRWARVEVVDPPTLASITLRAEPPAYSGLPYGEVGPDIRLLAGSRLTAVGAAESLLSSAELLIGEAHRVPLTVTPVEGTPGARVTTPPGGWVAEAGEGDRQAALAYRFRLESGDGITGETPAARLRVEPDKPPRVAWASPGSDRFVTAAAVLPIAVVAEDDLAIREVRVVVRDTREADAPPLKTPAESADGNEKPAPAPPTADEVLVLHRGPAKPPRRAEASLDGPTDRQAPELDWDLEPLALPVGATLELTAEAEDYRPGVGRAPSKRRVVIISAEEFNQRIADGQSQLLRDLQQALTAERDARDKGRGIADAARNPEAKKQTLLDRLSTLGFEQRRVRELVAGPQRGVVEQANRLLEELSANRADRPSLASQLERVAAAGRRLAGQPLPEASRAVADAQRSADSGDRSRLADSLAEADRQQSDVVDTLEQLAEEMAGWSDLEQFARELADLGRRQRALAEATRGESAKTAAGRRAAEKLRADRRRLGDAQSELTRRFDKLMRSMRRRLEASEGAEPDERLAPVGDTLADADERATAGKLRDATRQLRAGRLGRTADAQQAAAEDLRQLLETLRNRASGDPAELAGQLRNAKQRLGELQDELKKLAERPEADPRRRAQREERLAKAVGRLGRRLQRLTAERASASAAAGADRLAEAAQQSRRRQADPSRESRQQAEQRLGLAQEQIDERLRQLENEIAQRLLEQLATDVEDYLERQRRLLEQTVELADTLAPGAAELRRDAAPVAARQGRLGERVGRAAEKFAPRKVFSIALGSAADQMQSAAGRLAEADPGRATQGHELEAIERLKHIADALKPTAPEDDQPGENQQPPGGQGGQQPQKPPPFDVAELKMLRLMQLALNDRTRRFEAQRADGMEAGPRRAAARRLSAEQRELADLVQELLDRNNEDPRLRPPEEVL